MRPYKFRMRLSSRRLNVTRFDKAPAAAGRAAARASLGSASSEIKLMAHHQIHYTGPHDCADRSTPQGAALPHPPPLKTETCGFGGPNRLIRTVTGSLVQS